MIFKYLHVLHVNGLELQWWYLEGVCINSADEKEKREKKAALLMSLLYLYDCDKKKAELNEFGDPLS